MDAGSMQLEASGGVWKRLEASGGVSTSQPAFRLYSSTACVHLLHFYRAPVLFSVRIPTVFQHWMRAFLLIYSTLCMHFVACLLWTDLDCFVSVRISTVFQHCRRAFLLHCSTLCMLFYYTPALYSSTVCVHFYYIQALFWLHLHTFVCVCMYLYHIPYTILCIYCLLLTILFVYFLCAHCVQWLPHCVHTVYNGVSPNLKISNTLTSYLTGNSVQDT